MGKYFNTDETLGLHSAGTLRVQKDGDFFYVMKGGTVDEKGKLIQADPLVYCAEEQEAKELIEKLCNL